MVRFATRQALNLPQDTRTAGMFTDCPHFALSGVLATLRPLSALNLSHHSLKLAII